MYSVDEGKPEILLWCYETVEATPQSAKSSALSGPPTKVARTTNHSKHQDRLDEVDFIYEDLQKKHDKSVYSSEQLRAWAHLIHLKKHASYDDPPKKPFFKTTKEKLKSPSEPAGIKVESTASISPGKRLGLRSQCIDQLSQWHSLLEKGAITKQQYESMQTSIMDDMKKF